MDAFRFGLLSVLIGLYFAPAFIAWRQAHPNYRGIFLLNLLLGWTVVGWILAVVWAYTAVWTKRARP